MIKMRGKCPNMSSLNLDCVFLTWWRCSGGGVPSLQDAGGQIPTNPNFASNGQRQADKPPLAGAGGALGPGRTGTGLAGAVTAFAPLLEDTKKETQGMPSICVNPWRQKYTIEFR